MILRRCRPLFAILEKLYLKCSTLTATKKQTYMSDAPIVYLDFDEHGWEV